MGSSRILNAQLLDERVRALDLSDDQIARACGVDRSTVVKWRTTSQQPRKHGIFVFKVTCAL